MSTALPLHSNNLMRYRNPYKIPLRKRNVPSSFYLELTLDTKITVSGQGETNLLQKTLEPLQEEVSFLSEVIDAFVESPPLIVTQGGYFVEGCSSRSLS